MNIIQYILDLGPSVMLALVMFVLGIAFKVKLSTALRSALLIGVAFFGINMVIGALVGVIGPVTQGLIENTGRNLSVLDIGWPSAAGITWAYKGAALFIPVGIAVNIVLLLTKVTKTVDLDIWNYWVWGFSAAIIGTLTNNIVWGVIAFVITEVIVLIIADKSAPKIQEHFGMPNISIPHGNAAPFVPVAWVLNKLFDFIPGINKIDISTQSISKKFGIFGEPVFIGFLIGLILSVIAGYDFKGVLNTGIALAGIMVILPRVTKILSESLAPITSAISEFLRNKFPGREMYIGLDAAILAGSPDVMSTGLILIPLSILLAFVLPGNKLLPFADLVGLAFVVSMTLPIYKGNILRSVLGGIVIVVMCLYIGTALAPVFTDLATASGVSIPESTEGVMSFLSGTSPITYILKLVADFFASLGVA